MDEIKIGVEIKELFDRQKDSIMAEKMALVALIRIVIKLCIDQEIMPEDTVDKLRVELMMIRIRIRKADEQAREEIRRSQLFLEQVIEDYYIDLSVGVSELLTLLRIKLNDLLSVNI